MSVGVGDVITVLRLSHGLTQKDLAKQLSITQAALSRYEGGLREPEPHVMRQLCDFFGVTEKLLNHEFRRIGMIASEAHLRRQKTAKPAEWKRLEAELNVLRLHTSFVTETASLEASNFVPHLDPEEVTPTDAAVLLRSAWKMPIGPVTDLVRWIESAGVFVFEQDFGTARVDGMSQWAGETAVILVNARLPVDRKRWTLAHELGHLVMHSGPYPYDVEPQANDFAAEFLMPKTVITPELQCLTLGKLRDLKLEWGVSMQALFERAFSLGQATAQDRKTFLMRMSKQGWRTREPESENLVPEIPQLPLKIGQEMLNSGLSETEVRHIIGVAPGCPTPFLPQNKALTIVK